MRGSGRAGVADGDAAAGGAGAGRRGGRRLVAGPAGAQAILAWRASCSSSLLLGQDGLQHVAGLGDMREINLGCNGLGRARRRSAGLARRLGSTLKMRANPLGLMFFQRTGVGLAAARPSSASTSRICRLLTSISRARSLIRTLLIRLFSKCATQRRLVAHSYLMAMAAFETSIID